ncbi:unnamed protein product [Caenorhabditis bovis]|uniref:Uncharacterized protein n=1 Tax=Caenorhabditis bovis TaxID=2654633 RepID=A0A8S1EXL4_9PELO|nr:unnamed protein product [Caenorhabditis bovis]
MSRTIWLVRHGERIDNVDKKWKDNNPKKWDDPELTTRGKTQSAEVGKALANYNIEKIICSPFTRCVETAAVIVTMMQNPPSICIEPGFMEPLSSCMDPPSIPTMESLKNLTTRIDESYEPVMKTVSGETPGDLGCAERVINTFKGVLKKFPTGNLLIITHGTPIANLHAFIVGHWKYAGQCTIAKVTDNFGKFKMDYFNKKDHLSIPVGLHEDDRPVPR